MGIAGLLLWTGLATPVFADDSSDLAQERADFQRALAALKNNSFTTYRRMRDGLKDYPLYGYLEYEYISRHLSSTPKKDILDFLDNYSDVPVSKKLLGSWMRLLAARGDWKTYLAYYEPLDSIALECFYLRARLNTKRTDGLMESIAELWKVGKSQPDECDPVFTWWQKKGGLTSDLAWQRIVLSMAERNFSLAQFLARYLDDPRERKLVDLWTQLHSRPQKYLHNPLLADDNEKNRLVVIYGLKRLAQIDLVSAFEDWKQLRENYSFSTAELTDVERSIAIKAALDRHPNALQWLTDVNASDEDIDLWRIRTALVEKDWPKVLAWIDASPEEMGGSAQWAYWRGRALQEIGIAKSDAASVEQARQVFAGLAGKKNFYGFMAADQLGQPYDLSSESINFEERELAALVEHPGVVRAYELYRVGMIPDARREWSAFIARLDERHLQLAAILASRWGWHDRAILTVARTEHDSDLDLRFPMAYQDLVHESAQQNAIDPAWVYGVVRQESAFMPDARSSAGAMGLMQLMPQTARLTARMLNTSIKSKFDLLDAGKNIKLGTAYLRFMLEENNGHEALATASYNAGPHRVKRWMPDTEFPADLWVELIPFRETREYVRRVMAYTTIFDQRLDGQHKSLAERMPVIIPADKQ